MGSVPKVVCYVKPYYQYEREDKKRNEYEYFLGYPAIPVPGAEEVVRQ